MMYKKTTCLIFIFCLFLSTPVAFCKDFYVTVDSNGNGTIIESNAQIQINNAISIANAGDVVRLLPGTYNINAPIYMKSGISLCGAGSDKTVIKATPSDFSTKGTAIVYFRGISGAQISDLEINGGEPSLSSQHDNGGLDYENAIMLDGGSSDCAVHNIYFTALDGDGVRGGKTTSNIDVYNCQFICSGHDGVQVWYGNNWHITNCKADLFINSGMRLANSLNGEINDCFFYCDTGSGFVGVELEDNVDGTNICNNTFQRIHNGYGIGIATVHAYGTVNIWGNKFSDCPGGAMSLSGITVKQDQNNQDQNDNLNNDNNTFNNNLNNDNNNFNNTTVLPTADFTADITYGTAPLKVSFTSNCTGNPTGLNWAFGDGTYSNQNIAVTHTYTRPGRYNVSVTAINSAGFNTETKSSYIIVNTSNIQNIVSTTPCANFDNNNTNKNDNYTNNAKTPCNSSGTVPTNLRVLCSGKAPLRVHFVDRSKRHISYYWDFGDENTSRNKSITHIYKTPGKYLVKLTYETTGHYSKTLYGGYIIVKDSSP